MVLCCGGAGKTVVLEELRERSPFGAYLESRELRHLASACRIDKFVAGQEVRDSPFYIDLVDDGYDGVAESERTRVVGDDGGTAARVIAPREGAGPRALEGGSAEGGSVNGIV